MATPAVNITVGATDRTRAAFEAARRRIGGFAAAIGIASAAAFGLQRSLGKTIDRLDEIDKAARNAGIGAETLQTWRLFGETVGATAQQVDTSLRRLLRRTGEAVAGGEVRTAFEQLGIDAEFLAANVDDSEAVLARFARALREAESPTLAVAAGIRILDIEGARLVRGIVDGDAAFADFAARVAEAGAVLDAELLPRVVDAKDEFTIATRAVQAQKDALFVELIPAWVAVGGVIGNVADAIRWAREQLAAFLDTSLTADLRRQRDSLQAQYRALADRDETSLVRVDGRRISVLERRRQLLQEIQRINDNLFRVEERLAGRTPRAPTPTPRSPGVDVEREARDVETERLRIQLATVGLSGDEARLARLRHQLEEATTDEQREQLRTRIGLAEQLRDANAAEAQRVALETAIASLTRQTEAAHGGIEAALMRELGITDEMLAGSEELRAQFADALAKRREASDAARDEAVFGEVARALAEERARAAGVDVRLQRILVDLQRDGVELTQEEIDLLDERLKQLDELAFASDLREDLRGAVGDGLREGLRDFAEGGDIGDVFDSIGRRLSSLLLDLAIGQFGQGGAGGTGLLGFLGGLFGGRRERGGPVDAGRLYLIGERGPELFMPRTAGTVLASMGAGPPITQNITVRGTVRSDADVAAIAHRVAQQSVAGLVGAIRNGRVAA